MKLTKIIYVVRKYFCYQKEYYDFGCELMKAHGVDVEIWCDTFMYTPDAVIPETAYKGDELRYIHSIEEYNENIKRVKSNTVVFVLFHGDNRDEIGCEIRKTIFINGMQYCDLFFIHCITSIYWTVYPLEYRQLLVGTKKEEEIKKDYYRDISLRGSEKENILKRLRYSLKMITSKGIIGRFKKYLKKNYFIPKNPDTIICEEYPSLFSFVPTKFEAAVMMVEPKRIYRGKNNIYINTPDYDRFIDEDMNNNPIVEGEYAVLIDTGGRKHPDHPEEINTDENEAMQRTVKFIEDVEDAFGLKVVIALHPRVLRSSEEFGGREVYVNCTENLIHHSKLVLNPGSTVTSLIVLWNKPMIFYTPLLSEGSDYERRGRISADIFSSVFNADYYDIRNDKPEKLKKCLIQSSDRYDLYKEVFVKDRNSPDKKQFEIVYDALINA